MQEVKRILERKDGIKYIIVPKKSQLKKGDLVMLKKIKEEQDD